MLHLIKQLNNITQKIYFHYKVLQWPRKQTGSWVGARFIRNLDKQIKGEKIMVIVMFKFAKKVGRLSPLFPLPPFRRLCIELILFTKTFQFCFNCVNADFHECLQCGLSGFIKRKFDTKRT